MAYKRPGVFVQESLTPFSSAPDVAGEAVAAFVGTHNQGPTTPTLITSWAQWLAIFGAYGNGFGSGTDYLPFAVYQYFNNGGHQAYVVRTVPSDAVAASVTIKDRAGTPVNLFKVAANWAGAASNQIFVDITDTGTTGRFNLTLHFGGAGDAYIVERFVDLSLNPTDSRYAPGIINSPVTGSNYVTVTSLLSATWTAINGTPALSAGVALTSGADGAAAVDYVAAARTLESVTGIINLNLPGVTDQATINSVITWLTALPALNVFLVIDTPAASSTESASVTAYQAFGSGGSTSYTATSYAAVYGPWLLVDDPQSTTPGAIRKLPAGGAVLGRYAYTDSSRGVQKSPAGLATGALAGVLGVDQTFTLANQDILAVANVNLIKPVPGSGYTIWGDRTLKNGTADAYVPVRRTLQYIEKTLRDLTRFAVFEPNSDTLWGQIEAGVSQFLQAQWQIGMLAGASLEQAFFVICDSSNNTPSTVAAGQVNVQVGVALLSPAEFIVINIGQYDGGSTASES
jgi:phage tail sheath protein FI